MSEVPQRVGNEQTAGTGDVVPVFFLSDSTGISAETMGNALLIQFPGLRFERTVIPFISSVKEARAVVARIDAALDASARTPLVFTTAASDEVRRSSSRTSSLAAVVNTSGVRALASSAASILATTARASFTEEMNGITVRSNRR